MLTAIIAAIVGGGGLTAIGINVDRPALHSEVQLVATQTYLNQLDILYIHLQAIRDEIWELEDRIEDKGMTQERKDRMRQLEVEYDETDTKINLILKGEIK